MEGYLKGEVCNRDGCVGIIDEHYTDSCCSCHINPPCSYCTTSREYCPICDWDGREEQIENESRITDSYQATEYAGLHYYNSKEANIYCSRVYDMMAGKLPRPNELMYVDESHTHFSMIKKGVYPASMTLNDLVNKIQGSFGGRFKSLNKETGIFSYVAYTD